MNIKVLDFLKRYDVSFFLTAGLIFLIGVLNLYSGTHADASMQSLYKRQIILFSVAMLGGVGISFIRPKTLFRYSYIIYLLANFLLILVLFVGDKGMGAQRWLVLGSVRIQPSELMKVSIILALARWYSTNDPHKPLGFKELIMPSILTLIPTFLIVIEPDLGTGLMVLLIFGVITFYRKLKWKTMFILCVLGIISGTTMYKFGLKDYQKRRIVSFIDPTADVKGSGYNANQSKIAIGSGQFWGKGFKKSSQASLNYLPENHTDFVFSVFNEEHGFFGSVILILLYSVLFFRFIWLSTSVVTLFESIIAIGLMGVFFWHTFINMAMVTGLLPIVGLPLPLMSYGGSSLLTFGLCIGIATSISNSRNLF